MYLLGFLSLVGLELALLHVIHGERSCVFFNTSVSLVPVEGGYDVTLTFTISNTCQINDISMKSVKIFNETERRLLATPFCQITYNDDGSAHASGCAYDANSQRFCVTHHLESRQRQWWKLVGLLNSSKQFNKTVEISLQRESWAFPLLHVMAISFGSCFVVFILILAATRCVRNHGTLKDSHNRQSSSGRLKIVSVITDEGRRIPEGTEPCLELPSQETGHDHAWGTDSDSLHSLESQIAVTVPMSATIVVHAEQDTIIKTCSYPQTDDEETSCILPDSSRLDRSQRDATGPHPSSITAFAEPDGSQAPRYTLQKDDDRRGIVSDSLCSVESLANVTITDPVSVGSSAHRNEKYASGQRTETSDIGTLYTLPSRSMQKPRRPTQDKKHGTMPDFPRPRRGKSHAAMSVDSINTVSRNCGNTLRAEKIQPQTYADYGYSCLDDVITPLYKTTDVRSKLGRTGSAKPHPMKYRDKSCIIPDRTAKPLYRNINVPVERSFTLPTGPRRRNYNDDGYILPDPATRPLYRNTDVTTEQAKTSAAKVQSKKYNDDGYVLPDPDVKPLYRNTVVNDGHIRTLPARPRRKKYDDDGYVLPDSEEKPLYRNTVAAVGHTRKLPARPRRKKYDDDGYVLPDSEEKPLYKNTVAAVGHTRTLPARPLRKKYDDDGYVRADPATRLLDRRTDLMAELAKSVATRLQSEKNDDG